MDGTGCRCSEPMKGNQRISTPIQQSFEIFTVEPLQILDSNTYFEIFHDTRAHVTYTCNMEGQDRARRRGIYLVLITFQAKHLGSLVLIEVTNSQNFTMYILPQTEILFYCVNNFRCKYRHK